MDEGGWSGVSLPLPVFSAINFYFFLVNFGINFYHLIRLNLIGSNKIASRARVCYSIPYPYDRRTLMQHRRGRISSTFFSLSFNDVLHSHNLLTTRLSYHIIFFVVNTFPMFQQSSLFSLSFSLRYLYRFFNICRK